MKRTSTKSLQLELVTEYDTNDAQKESFVGGRGGSKSAKEGPYPSADLDGGGRVAVCNVDLFSGQVTPFIALIQLSFIQ